MHKIFALQTKFTQVLTFQSQVDPIRRRLTGGILWSLLGNGFSQGVKLITSILLAQMLGKVHFGELGILINTILLFGTFAGLGLGLTATKYVAELRIKDTKKTGRLIGFLVKLTATTGLIIGICIFWGAPVIATKILNAEHLTVSLRILCFALLLDTLNGVQIGTLVGLEAFRTIAYIGIFNSFLYLAIVCLGAWYFDLQGAVGGYLCVSIISFALNQIGLQKEAQARQIQISFSETTSEWSILWKFGIPALLVTLSTQPFSWLTRVILAHQPGGYAELGILNAAFSWTSIILFLPQQISRPTMPILSNLYGEERKGDFSKVIRLNLLLTGVSALAIALPMILLSQFGISLYGTSFISGWPTFLVMIIAYTIGAVTISFRDIIASSGVMWWQAIHSLIWGLALICVTTMLLAYEALGIAIAHLIAYTLLLAVQTLYLRIKLK